MHNNPLTRQTDSNCMAYAPIESENINYKYFWRNIPCGTKAPFICQYNPDLLGYHKLSNLVVDKTLDVKLPSMSATTCLSLCQVTSEASQVAFILEDRCICSKCKIFSVLFENYCIFIPTAPASFKKPIFKVMNELTGKYLTATGPDLPIILEDDNGTPGQHW